MSTFQRVGWIVFSVAIALGLAALTIALSANTIETTGAGDATTRIIETLGGVLGLIAIFAGYSFDSAARRRQADTIVKGSVTPPTKPPAEPLTDHEKIDALYRLSKSQSRDQFFWNFVWAVVGILGGYVAGRLLPHL